MRLLLVVPLLLAVIACTEEKASVVSTSTPDVTGEPATEAPPTEAAPDVLNLKVGDTAQIGDARVTVHSSRMDPGSEFSKPEIGKAWIIVDATVENTGDDEYNLSSLLQTAIRDSADREHDDLAFAETSGSLDGAIPSGQPLRGERAYEIPADATGLQFVFKQAFGSEQARWNLQ